MDADVKEQLDKILSRYGGKRSDLIPILHETQEKFGYLPEEAMKKIAKFLRLAESNVYGVAAFYHDFRFTPPQNNKVIKVCQGSACHVRGARQVLGEVEKHLGVKMGGTTSDGKYSIEEAPCPGLCAMAPIIEIGECACGNMTADKVKPALDSNK